MTFLLRHFRDIITALALLTRLPVRARFDRTANAAWAWPLVGLPVATLAWLIGIAALGAGLPAVLAAGLLLGSQAVVTGAMHEDGLADCADGFWGGFDRTRRLEIMRDSHLGSYGALALIGTLGLRWGALAIVLSLPAWESWIALTLAGLGSRAAMLALAAALPHARADGLSVATGRPPGQVAVVGIGLATVLAVGLAPMAAPIAYGVAALLTLGCGALARRKVGGQTGDVLGATQQVTEIAILLTLVAVSG